MGTASAINSPLPFQSRWRIFTSPEILVGLPDMFKQDGQSGSVGRGDGRAHPTRFRRVGATTPVSRLRNRSTRKGSENQLFHPNKWRERMKRSVWALAAASLMLGACGPIKSDSDLERLGLGPQVCNAPANHCRPVTVYNDTIVPIADVHVTSPNNQIFWEITTSGYVFASNGIEFKHPTDVPRDEFTCNPIGTKVFHCVDRNTKRGRYDYKVTITTTNGARTLVLDPSIFND
jgi:hypothetical protein